MRDPDYSGRAKVWRIKVNDPVSLSSFIIHGPYHPLWSWWLVSLVHLRDVEGMPPAVKRFSSAEYEILCLSLNPDPDPPRPKIPDIDLLDSGEFEKGMPGYLTPPDWVVQFGGVTDEVAIKIAEAVASSISQGASCDSDYRSWWEELIPRTVEHFRLGIHT